MTTSTDPLFLLNSLKPVLGVDGDIKTPQEVLRVVGLMKDAEKMMSRCIFLNVLRATCNQSKLNGNRTDTLDRFLVSGGWGILNKWLNEYSGSENVPVLLEIIEVLRYLPVTISILKQGNTGKVVNKLTKNNNPDVKNGALQLIKQWKSMIRGGNHEKQSKSNSKETTERGEESPSSTGKRQRQGSTEEKMQPPPEKKVKQIDEKQQKGRSPDAKGVVVESFGLMNAIGAVASKVPKKKKKPLQSKPTLPLDDILNSKPKPNESQPDASPMREQGGKGEKAGDVNIVEENSDQSRDTEMDVNDDEDSSRDGTQPPSNKKKKGKKSISWAEEDNLIKVFYFELDEEERAAMHHTISFMAAKHNELIREREALENARRLGEDRMIEKARWKRPPLVELTPLPIEPGEKSREKYIQKEREQKVLADIFLTKASLPDSPAEPDNLSDESGSSEPKLIPHDEEGTLYPKPSIQVMTSTPSSVSTQPAVDTAPKSSEPEESSSLLGDPTAEMLASTKDKDAVPVNPSLMNPLGNSHIRPNEFPHLNGPELIGRGGRPIGPGPHPHGFPTGPPRFLIRPGAPRLMMNMPYRPRGNFRGRPMIHRGGLIRSRFHGPAIGMEAGKQDPMHGTEEQFRGRGRARGGQQLRGRGKRDPPPCRHFMTPNGCRNGQNCNFSHALPGRLPR